MYNISIRILNDIFKDTKIDSSWRVFVEHWIIGVQQKNIKKLQTFCRRITGFSIKNQNYLPLLSKPVSYRYLGQIVSLYGDTNIIKGRIIKLYKGQNTYDIKTLCNNQIIKRVPENIIISNSQLKLPDIPLRNKVTNCYNYCKRCPKRFYNKFHVRRKGKTVNSCLCVCNDLTADNIWNYVLNTSDIKQVFRILAMDNLTGRVRYRLSRKIYNRYYK